MPEPEKLEREPPETEMSDLAKFEEVSERMKLRVAVWPAFSEATLEVRAMVGLTVSMGRVSLLLWSLPSALLLAAAFVNVPLATEITPLVVLLVLGVKVAE